MKIEERVMKLYKAPKLGRKKFQSAFIKFRRKDQQLFPDGVTWMNFQMDIAQKWKAETKLENEVWYPYS